MLWTRDDKTKVSNRSVARGCFPQYVHTKTLTQLTHPSARFPQNSTNQLPTPAPKQPCNSAVEQHFFFFSVTQPPTCSIHKLGIIQTQTTEQEKKRFEWLQKHARASSSPALYKCKQ